MAYTLTVAAWLLLSFCGVRAVRDGETQVLTTDVSSASARSTAVVNGTTGREQTKGVWESTCGSDFTIVMGQDTDDTQRIAEGLKEWVDNIRSGAWGVWLQERLSTVEGLYRQGIRDGRLTLDGSMEKEKETSPQVYEAWKLSKIVFLQYFPELVIGSVVVRTPVPDIIASFADGRLQSVGKLEFDETITQVYFPLAVTRYTISYDVKGTEAASSAKGAGKALLAGWIEENMVELEDNLIVYTFPASAFVRKHYIKNGAVNACAAGKRASNEECTTMAEEGNNCDCDVRLCLQNKCLMYFDIGMCGTPSVFEATRGYAKGCYTLSGDFAGSCNA